MIDFLHVFWIFFKIGLFTVGGGLAALPLLQSEAITRNWVTDAQFADMVAISESTPGPIGINMATYVGFNQLGVLGSIVATLGMVAPSIIIICIIAKFLHRFSENKTVKGIFFGLRPAAVGLISAAAFNIALIALFDIDLFRSTKSLADLFNLKAIAMFAVFMYATNKWKHHPVFYIVIAGVIGIFIF